MEITVKGETRGWKAEWNREEISSFDGRKYADKKLKDPMSKPETWMQPGMEVVRQEDASSSFTIMAAPYALESFKLWKAMYPGGMSEMTGEFEIWISSVGFLDQYNVKLVFTYDLGEVSSRCLRLAKIKLHAFKIIGGREL
jgi:hypothetical protein